MFCPINCKSLDNRNHVCRESGQKLTCAEVNAMGIYYIAHERSEACTKSTSGVKKK